MSSSSRSLTRRVSLLIRNLPLDARPDDVRKMFERYGEVREVYLPNDYYTRKPKGFGFVEFMDNRDAEDALYALDRTMVGGREISVVMSKESRKTPRDMMKREDVYPARPSRGSGGSYRDRSRSRSRSRDRGHDRDRGYSSRDRGGRSSHRSRSRSRSRSREDRRRDDRDERRDRGRSASPRSRSRSRGDERRRERGSRSPPPPARDDHSPRDNGDGASPRRRDDSPARDRRPEASPRRDSPRRGDAEPAAEDQGDRRYDDGRD